MSELSGLLGVRQNDVVSFVGAGGKTTSMLTLAAELAPRGTLLVTTTTRMWNLREHPARLGSAASLLSQLPPAGRINVFASGAELSGEREKLTGIAPQDVDLLAGSGCFDWILVEADGAAGRLFKAPASHEPVVASSTTMLVMVFAADILGKPLTDQHVHRLDHVVRCARQPEGSRITAGTVLGVLSHPEGGRKRKPPRAKAVVLCTRTDLVDQAILADFRQTFRGHEFDRVVLWSNVRREGELVT
ncbi:MAG: selenium cofactor biosynthesis protein YqeC [Bacillota bacterium]